MGRKIAMFGPRAEVLEAESAVNGSSDHEGPKPSPELGIAAGSNGAANGRGAPKRSATAVASALLTDWSPEQTEQYIDWRLQALDTEIARQRSDLEELTATRKRWLAVTGGRSKLNGSAGSIGPNGC